MKKLIALLSGISLTASTASLAVACTNFDQRNDGNSILVQFLQSMNGYMQIDASDVLWQLINASGPEGRENFLIQMLKMINISIISNSESNFTGEDSILDEGSRFVNKDLNNALVNRWNTLSNAVSLQIQRERDNFRRLHGRNWEREWRNMLAERYSVYQTDTRDYDLEFLEARYKTDILMSDGPNGATRAILDVVLNTDSYGVTWVNSTTVASKWRSLNNVLDNDANFQQVFESDTLAIQQIINANQSDAISWTTQTEFTLTEARNIVSNITDESHFTNDVPEDAGAWTNNGVALRAGMLSNSQMFFLNKWFEVAAPLAISEVIIPFSDNQNFEDGITFEDFTGDGNTDLTANNQLLAMLSDDTLWDVALVNNEVFSAVQPRVTVRTNDSLLTLTSTEFSDTLKTVVYDFVLGGDGAANVSGTTIEALTTGLNRSNDNQLYSRFGNTNDRLVFIDTNGINIIRIEGFEHFNQTNNINSRLPLITELQNFNSFHNLRDPEKIDGILMSESYLNRLNTGIENRYLQFLVNSSLLNGLASSPVSYDIMNEVRSWATLNNSSTTETFWITTIFEYFATISNIIPENNISNENISTFVSKFLVFGVENPHDEQANEIARSMEQWTVNSIATARQTIQIASSVRFIESFRNWRRTLEANTAADFPRGTIAGSAFVDSTLAQTVANLWSSNVLSRNISSLSFYFTYNTLKGVKW